MQTRVSRSFSFEAAHQLEWHSGACKNLHGHSYRLDVSVVGDLDGNGIVIDFADLAAVVQAEILDRFDHTYLNDLLPNPTAELIAADIWTRFARRRTVAGPHRVVGDGQQFGGDHRVTGAVVVLSGGLDSTVCLAEAVRGHDPVIALSIDYGQRHQIELERAAAIAAHFGVEHIEQRLDLRAWGGSALTDASIDIPTAAVAAAGPAIPITYVPGRNLIFLSLAVALAEARQCGAVFIGVNALDYSGYPDCRPEFIESFRATSRLALRVGVEGAAVDIRTPLIDLSKADIVQRGIELHAPLQLTWSCYRGEERPCGDCDSCVLRAKGFTEAGVADPAREASERS